MNRIFPHKNLRIIYLLTALSCYVLVSSFSATPKKTGALKVIFINTANGKPIVLRDSMYTNYFGERYSISKLKYYISNITLGGDDGRKNMGGYYLMNAAADENGFELSLPSGKYNSLQFLLGVDSVRNCSGAQTGALDPMNDMFWTWNSGYVMFKMEGTSTASTADLQRIEHHVGGYKGTNNVATQVNFDLPGSGGFEIKENGTTQIVIELNIDHYWHSNADIKISELPVCTTTGELAKKIASNFKNIFSVKNIQVIP